MALCTIGGKDLRERADDQLAAWRLWASKEEREMVPEMAEMAQSVAR